MPARSPNDPDAFTMGARKLPDFLLFYGYGLAGGVLTVIHKGLVGGALLREAVIAECLDTSCELGDGIHGHRAPRITSGIDRDSSPIGLRGEP